MVDKIFSTRYRENDYSIIISIYLKNFIFCKISVSVFLTLLNDGSKMDLSHYCHSDARFQTNGI